MLDPINLDIIDLLQHEGRMSFKALGERVGLTAPAVTERVRKLEDAGIITGYRAIVDYERLGLTLLCVIRLNSNHRNRSIDEVVRDHPEIIEALRVTGSESHVIRARVRDTHHLEELLSRFGDYGDTITNIATSLPVQHRPIRISGTLRHRLT